MGCTSSQPVQPVRQQLTLARIMEWLPELNSTETRVVWCVGQPPRADADPDIIVNGVRKNIFVGSVEVDEIML